MVLIKLKSIKAEFRGQGLSDIQIMPMIEMVIVFIYE